MDLGLLLVRLLIAAILFAHGAQKAFGWFSGPGPKGAAALFDKLGQLPSGVKVRLAVICEMGAAVLLGLGLATPLGAAIAAGTMLVAGFSLNLLSGTFWNAAGGGEYPIALAGIAVCLGFTGPGRYALDAILPVVPLTGDTAAPLTGIAVLVIAVIAAAVPIAGMRRVRAERLADAA